MKEYAFVDLHIHTVHSYEDGADLKVEELLDILSAMAEKEDKEICFSITDHENILGCIEAYNLIKSNPQKYSRLKFIPGIECNTSLKDLELNSEGHSVFRKCHLLAYDYNLNDKNLLSYSKISHLTVSENGKKSIIGKLIISAKNKLEELHNEEIPFNYLLDCCNFSTYDDVRNVFLNICSKYYQEDFNALSKQLNDEFPPQFNVGKNALAKGKVSILQLIRMIKSAGGKVGIAHGKTIDMKNVSKKDLDFCVFQKFVETLQDKSNNALDFVELFHNCNMSRYIFSKIYETAKKYNLYLTVGSDFHGTRLHPDAGISKYFSRSFNYFANERNSNNAEIESSKTCLITGLPFVDDTINKPKVSYNKQDFICRGPSKEQLSYQDALQILDKAKIWEMQEKYKATEQSALTTNKITIKENKTSNIKKNKQKNIQHQKGEKYKKDKYIKNYDTKDLKNNGKKYKTKKKFTKNKNLSDWGEERIYI